MALSFVGSPAFVVAEKSGAAAPMGKRPSPPSGRFTGPLHATASATIAIHFMVISLTLSLHRCTNARIVPRDGAPKDIVPRRFGAVLLVSSGGLRRGRGRRARPSGSGLR